MTLYGIIPVRLVDLVEIALVTYLLYRLYKWMRGTLAVSIFIGLVSVYLVQFLVGFSGMKILQALFGSLSEIYFLAAIIIFQPELRRVLLLVGQAPLLRQLLSRAPRQELIAEVVGAVRILGDTKTGGLIAIKRFNGLRTFAETGERINASVSRDLILTLFYSQNPLHDGAVIIAGGRIEAARCILPVSRNLGLSSQLGLRHRAAVGLSEETDAFVIVVSEETGQISVVEHGAITPIRTMLELHKRCSEALGENILEEAST